MKIAIAVHHFPPSYSGGAEGQALRQAQALQARGHAVRVITVERVDRGPAAGVDWHDDEYQGVSVRRLSFKLSNAPDMFRYGYDNPWVGEHLRGWLLADRPDVFYLIGGYLLSGAAINTARDLGIPTAVSPMDLWFLCPRLSMMRSDRSLSTFPIRAERCAQCLGEEQRRFLWLGKLFPGVMARYWANQQPAVQRIEHRAAFLRETLRRADIIITDSQFLRAALVDNGQDKARVAQLRQGRDFTDLTLADLIKTPADVLRLGYIGQVAELKGIHVLIEAVRRLPGRALALTIYGDANRFPAYTRRLQRLAAGDARIQFAGTFNGARAASDAYRALDALVVPSIWYENSPNVILEAFAHRTPVIASNLGGMAEMVSHERSGLLFDHGDAKDLARAIARLLDEPDLLPRLAQGIEPVKSEAQEMDELTAILDRITLERA